MARAAVPGGLSGAARLAGGRARRATARDRQRRTLVLDVDGWPGHLPASTSTYASPRADGYTAARSYSLASAPEDGDRVEITVQRVAGRRGLAVPRPTTWRSATRSRCAARSVAGSSGGRADRGPVLLVGRRLRRRPADGDDAGPRPRGAAGRRSGSSTRCARPTTSSTATSSRRWPPTDGGRRRLRLHPPGAPTADGRPVGRLRERPRRSRLDGRGRTHVLRVRADRLRRGAADLLVALGHAPDRIRTERFGPSGP